MVDTLAHHGLGFIKAQGGGGFKRPLADRLEGKLPNASALLGLREGILTHLAERSTDGRFPLTPQRIVHDVRQVIPADGIVAPVSRPPTRALSSKSTAANSTSPPKKRVASSPKREPTPRKWRAKSSPKRKKPPRKSENER
jgi:hypothetical protein